VADRVENGEVQIEHCPTLDMWADYFTKPLQGALFYKMRDQIMNIEPNSEFHSSAHRSVLRVSEKIRVSEKSAVDERAGARVSERADARVSFSEGVPGTTRNSEGQEPLIMTAT
jgi:hypothetical protein